MGTLDLSLTGELLWLSIDPARGGLLPGRGRGRLRTALATAHRIDDPSIGWHPAPGLRAGRAGRRELIDAGLVEPALLLRNLRLAERRPAGERFRALWQGLEADSLIGAHDRELAVLLASAGVLGARLSTHQREIASRRFRAMVAANAGATGGDASMPHATPMSDGIAALGHAALSGIEHALNDAVHDLGHTDFGGHHGGGGHHGDGDAGGG